MRAAGRRHVTLLLVLLALLGPGASATATGDALLVVVITGPAGVGVPLTRERVADIFLGRATPGEVWHPIDSSDEALREQFYQRVAGMSANRARAHWARLVFAARAAPPRELTTAQAEEAVLADNLAITYTLASRVPRDAHVVLRLDSPD